MILDRLLETEKDFGDQLISKDEIDMIESTWADELLHKGRTIIMSDVYLGDLPLWSENEAREVMKKLYEKHTRAAMRPKIPIWI
jgi:hypothetical protein